MSFRKPLERIVSRADGASGAVFVDDTGETIAQFTKGDLEEIRLAGAHHGIVLQNLMKATRELGNGDRVQGVSITSQNHLYTMVPVDAENFLVLVQDRLGLSAQGMRVMRQAVEEIRELI